LKILHTADWHLGAKTEGKNRIQEQRKVMAEIVDVARQNNVDIVLIAGDIFDQSVPTSEAENLFYETLEALSKEDDRVVVVIAGNHDDPKRLTAGEHFARKHNVILAGDLNPKIKQLEFSRGKITSSSQGSVEIEIKTNRGKEKCVVAMLPYPAEYRFEEISKEESYSGKVKDWSRIVTKGFKKDTVNILVSHLMVVGAKISACGEEKELRIGDINVVSKSDLPNADYYALGHIHSYQNMKGNFCYSGSPMYFDFNQKSAGVCLIDAKPKGGIRDVSFISLTSPCKMEEIMVESIAEAEERLKSYSQGDIVNITFNQDEPLSMVQIKNLKNAYPCLSKVMLKLRNIGTDEKIYVTNRKKLEATKLFMEFYKQKKLTEPTRELVALFKELMEDNSSETN